MVALRYYHVNFGDNWTHSLGARAAIMLRKFIYGIPLIKLECYQFLHKILLLLLHVIIESFRMLSFPAQLGLIRVPHSVTHHQGASTVVTAGHQGASAPSAPAIQVTPASPANQRTALTHATPASAASHVTMASNEQPVLTEVRRSAFSQVQHNKSFPVIGSTRLTPANHLQVK